MLAWSNLRATLPLYVIFHCLRRGEYDCVIGIRLGLPQCSWHSLAVHIKVAELPERPSPLPGVLFLPGVSSVETSSGMGDLGRSRLDQDRRSDLGVLGPIRHKGIQYSMMSKTRLSKYARIHRPFLHLYYAFRSQCVLLEKHEPESKQSATNSLLWLVLHNYFQSLPLPWS